MSRLGRLYIKLGEPEGEMPGCCETADWAAGHIEELQTELNEQCRLLGMRAEREMALNSKIQHLINERNALGLAIDRALAGIVPDEHPLRSRLVEIAAMRAQPAPSVPAPIEGAKYMSNDWFYAEGWNDCRAEVLDAQPAPSVPEQLIPIGREDAAGEAAYIAGWYACRNEMLGIERGDEELAMGFTENSVKGGSGG